MPAKVCYTFSLLHKTRQTKHKQARKKRGKPTTNRLNRINSLPNTHTTHTRKHATDTHTHSHPYRSQGLCMRVVNDSLLIAHFPHTHTHAHKLSTSTHTHTHAAITLHMIFKCFWFFYSPAFHLIFAKQISRYKKGEKGSLTRVRLYTHV